jgi:hypothetical protein
MIINKDTLMNTQTTVLLMGALAKVMELSRANCSVIAEQTVIALQALDRSSGIPLSLKAQIEEMLDTLEEQYQLDRNQQTLANSYSQPVNSFCIHPIQIHDTLLFEGASLK